MRARLLDRSARAVAGGVAAMVVAALLAVPGVVGAQESDGPRTTVEGLGGYAGEGEGAPFSVQFFHVTGGTLPTDPGEPEFEATEAYSRAVLGTGPQSRATASSAWPGPAFGDGFATICDCGEDYLVKADARYPEGPEFEDDQTAPGTGTGMLARAQGLDVLARASAADSPNDTGAGFGTSSSRSTSTVTEDGVVVVSVDASVQDVDIGDGAITIDAVRTVLTATSDGRTATTHGTTTVSGLTFMGVPFRFTDEGLEAGGEGSLVPPPGNVVTPEELGITIELVDHDETVEGATGGRFAGGLIITVPSRSFAEGFASVEEGTGQDLPVDPLSPPQTGVHDELDRGIAQTYVRLFPFFTTAPTVRYVIGRARVTAAASPPFTLPDLPGPGFGPPPASSSSPTGGAVESPAFGSGSLSPSVQPDEPSEVAPPGGGQVLAAAPELPDWFDGLPLALFLLGAIVTGVGGYGLRGLAGAALGSGSSQFCETGAPKRAPNLRAG